MMKMTRIRSLAAALALGLGLPPLASLMAQDAPRLLPFQGRLTDQSGVPVTNGVKVVQFKIFDQPTAGNAVWAGEVHRTTINGGLVNVLLGSKTPLPSTNGLGVQIFNQQLYLEITVDINGDNAITIADPPMLPRQVILPTIFAKETAFAKESDNARKLGGIAAADFQAEDTRKLGGLLATNYVLGLVPVGSVLPFYGNLDTLPPNWKICDGSVVSDPLSSFNGQSLPDLREMFVRGASSSYPVSTTGGQDSVGTHSHSFFDTDNSVYFPRASLNGYTAAYRPANSAGGFDNTLRNITIVDPDSANWPKDSHSHSGGSSTVSGTTGSSGSHDNRPRFFSLNHIIRIR